MTQTKLDLEQYFERDIIEFLDKQKELQDDDDKNTSSEMLSALETNNISVAAKLLEDTILNYNKLSSGFYKDKNFRKITEMYRQAKEFVKLNPRQSRLKEIVDTLTHSRELEQGTIEKITALDRKFSELEAARTNAREQEEIFAKKLDRQIKEINNAITLNIKRKDLVPAIKNYKELKMYFEQYPSTEIEKKQELYNDMLSFFMQITKLKKELREDHARTLSDNKRLELATKNNANNYLRLSYIKDLIDLIKDDVKQTDFDAATQKTLEIRQIISRIPDQYKHVRAILNSKVDIIVQRIEFIKRIKNHNQ
jgi:hypothetical protein